ncbi:MAG: ice-binding family protein [Bacteroidota bacterium]
MNILTNNITTIRSTIRFVAASLAFLLMISGTVQSQVLQPVDLNSTANFVVLAGSLVSNVPTSDVTGDIGLSPAAGSGITGFGLLELNGKFYTVDATGPVGATISPVILTAAKGDLTIAYNDAAGRTPIPSGTFLNPGTGNIGGMTLVPGLYKFTTTAAITGSDVTLSGNSTAVWIFQIGTTLNVGTGIKVILAGGAKASNIFWQVGTSATLGTTSVFKGTIMAAQSISLATGAALEGRALASSAAVTLAANVITLPSSVTAAVGTVVPKVFALEQNYPNPFNPSTVIQYSIEKPVHVSLKVYNLIGGEVATLVQEEQVGGVYAVQFNTNTLADNISSGVYFYRLNAGSFVSTKKFTLLK